MPSLDPSPLAARVEAEILALRALDFVAGDAERLARFVDRTGAPADDPRRPAGDARFLGAVLDFLLADETTLRAFAERAGVRPEAPSVARRRLPGAPVAG